MNLLDQNRDYYKSHRWNQNFRNEFASFMKLSQILVENIGQWMTSARVRSCLSYRKYRPTEPCRTYYIPGPDHARLHSEDFRNKYTCLKYRRTSIPVKIASVKARQVGTLNIIVEKNWRDEVTFNGVRLGRHTTTSPLICWAEMNSTLHRTWTWALGTFSDFYRHSFRRLLASQSKGAR